MVPFTHLHVHSQFSLLDGQAAINKLVDKAIADGQKGIALTDHGNMFGIKELFDYVSKVNKGKEVEERFKPILGCEMYVAKKSLYDRGDKTDNGYHLIVLAKNKVGYKNLIKLVSKAWTDGFYFKPRTDREELSKHKEGLIIASACLGGEIPQKILNGQLKDAEETVLWFKEQFGDDYYLELQRHKTFKTNANYEVYAEQEKVNIVLIELARKHNINLIATNDVHFVNEDDAEAHDRLICISMQKRFADPTRMHYTKQEWLKSISEMNEIFSDIPEALENTNKILEKVEFYSIDHGPIMPNYEIPAEFGSEEEYRQRLTEKELFDEFTQDENGNVVLSEKDANKKIESLGGYEKLYRIKFEADYLAKLTMEGAAKRYGTPLRDDVAERLKFELHIMKTMGFPGYFLIVQDFINIARSELGVSVGPGRGSAAGSAAAYCLGITQIDPIKYDLLFERFLNPDRISLPDIDVDFDDDGRYEVLKYVTEKYGEEKVAHIITYGTMATKMAIKDVAKVLELPLVESNRLAKLVPDKMPEVDGKTPKTNFKNCLKYVKEFAAEKESENPTIREVMDYAEQLEGTVRNTGVHACGVIIGRDDITDWVPVSTATDTDGSKVLVTQYEGSVIENTGLIKMDFLGLKTLSIIKEALANIKLRHGIEIDIENIPLDDSKTYELYCKGNTTGTFQFESTGMQKYLRELKPSKFEDLIAMNALYRPGPMEYIPQFIARKHGLEPISYDIPIMEQYLEDTYGITVYQEQVMLLSRLLANFTRGESDVLRKAMGKKQIEKMNELKVKFLDGGRTNGHNTEVLEKIWADWEKFASYAFNKSHATCYSWVAYQTAYLKANYPAEYMAGVLSRNLSNMDKLSKFMDECRAMNIIVKGPDINESMEKFSVTQKGEIRFGLGAIKSIGANAVQSIIEERNANGAYRDIFDFVERVNLGACNRSAIENLALAGAFDCFDEISRETIVTPIMDVTFADILVKYGLRFQSDKNSIQGSLFDDFEPIETARPKIPQVEKWSKIKLLDEEKRLVGMYLSAHPLDSYFMELEYGCNTKAIELKNKEIDGMNVTLGGLVTNYQEKVSKTGNTWGILTIEDYSGSCDIRLFGKDLLNYKIFAVEGTAIYVKASFLASKYKENQVNMNINSIQLLEDIKGKIVENITLYIDENLKDTFIFEEISKYRIENGGSQLLVNISMENGQEIKLQSRKEFNITKDLINLLKNNNISFEINSQKKLGV